MAQVIKRTWVNPWGQAFGAIGQGLSGFGSGYMAGKQLNMMKDYNALLAQQFGRNGEKIQPPIAGATQQPTAAAQPAQNEPTTQGGVDGQASGGTIPMPQNYDEMLRALIAYKNPYDYTYTG